MRNAMVLVGLWVGIILTAFTLVYLGVDGPAPAQLALVEQRAQRTYIDAEGRFQFEKPPGWRASSEQGVVYTVGPLERLEAWVFSIEGADITQAAEIACELVDPCPGKEVASVESETPPEFAYAKERITYTIEEEDSFLYAVGFRVEDGALILLVRGDQAQRERRATDLVALEESLRIPDAEDLPPAGDEPVAEEPPEMTPEPAADSGSQTESETLEP